MSEIITFVKDKDVKQDFTVDWSRRLPTGTSIASSSWGTPSPSTMTVVSDSNTGTTATVVLDGGVEDVTYRVVNSITRDDGIEDERTIQIFSVESAVFIDVRKIRFLVGDDDVDNQRVRDENIVWALKENNDNVYSAAAQVAEAMAARFTDLVDKSVGDLRISYGKRAENYWTLAKKLRNRAAKLTHPPYAGGLERSDRDLDEEDTSLIQPSFKRGLHDGPYSSADPSEVTE